MDDPDDWLHRAWQAYAAGTVTAGITLAQRALATLGDDGPAWYALACLLERAERIAEAASAFQRAANTRRDPIPAPTPINPEDFQRLARSSLQALPRQLQSAATVVSLICADYPLPHQWSPDTVELLGCFEGPTMAEEADGVPEPGPRLYVFRRPHEHACRDRVELEHELRQTVIHELGHYLTLDEDDLEQLGLG